MKSIWYDGVKIKKEKPLNEDIITDILIIGGGITGISIAYHLIESNYKVCLVDANTVGCATTSKSTGKLTYLQDKIYNDVISMYGVDIASKYLKSQIDAIKIVENIIDKEKIKCDLERADSIIYTNNNINKLRNELKFLNNQNIDVMSGKRLGLFKSKYSISVSDTYVFNPLKYVNSLKKIIIDNKIKVYEDTKVTSYEKQGNLYVSKANNHKIVSKYIVFANHYPWFIKPYFMPIKTYKEKSTIFASKIDDINNQSGINIDSDTISYRYYKDYLICLNDTHKICNKMRLTKNDLLNKFSRYVSDIDYIWTNHDLMTHDYMPYIGKLVEYENLYIATGYNTWGLTSGSLAGKIISDMILKVDNEYQKIFSPLRPIKLKALPNIFNNICCNVKAYLKPKNNQKGYRCPHMGCKIDYNELDDTWDCPCHGSNFDCDGKCLNGPSIKDINMK